MVFGQTFERIAPILMGDLIKSLELTPNQAAGFCGNFGHESGLVSGQQEGWPIGSTARIRGLKGGIDWAQWTANRRTDFAEFVDRNGLPYPSYKASLAFVLHELKTTEKKALAEVRKTKTLEGATQAVQDHYERPGVKATQSRIDHAKRALELYEAGPKADGGVTVEERFLALERSVAALSRTVTDLAVQVAKLAEDQGE